MWERDQLLQRKSRNKQDKALAALINEE